MQLGEKHTKTYIESLSLAKLQAEFTMACRAHLADKKTSRENYGIDAKTLADLTSCLDAIVPKLNEKDYNYEKANIAAAVEKLEVKYPPYLNNPYNSLLWALNLAHLVKTNPDFYSSKLWKEFTSEKSPLIHQKYSLACQVAACQVSRNTRIGWEKLGKLYYFHLYQNYIGVDLITALGIYFDMAIAAVMHECGHHFLSYETTVKIKEVHALLEEFDKNRKQRKLTRDEAQEARRLHMEFQFRQNFLDECENNPVDQWVVNRSASTNSDLYYKRNYVEATLASPLLLSDAPYIEDTTINRIANLKNIIRYSFFRKNGYFEDTPEGWASLGLRTDWVTLSNGEPAFEKLLEMCEKAQNLQPTPRDRLQGGGSMDAIARSYCVKRYVIYDDIYDIFTAHLVEQFLQEKKEQEKNESKGQGQGESQESEGEGEGEEKLPKITFDFDPETGKVTAEVEGYGEIDFPALPPLTPGDKFKGKPSEDSGDKGETIEVIIENWESHKNGGGLESPGAEVSGPGANGKPNPRSFSIGGAGSTNKASEPKIGDWADYHKAKSECVLEIEEMKRLLAILNSRQMEFVPHTIDEHSLLPEDGNMERLDLERLKDMSIQHDRYSMYTEDSLKIFTMEKPKQIITEMNIIFLMDGSGSMFSQIGEDERNSPIMSGLSAGCVLNEASKKDDFTEDRNINFYMGLWGNQTPLMLVNPGDEPYSIEQMIAGVIKSQGWGTSLAPGIAGTVHHIANREPLNPHAKIGNTHFIILSDGDIFDEKASSAVAQSMLKSLPNSTMDFIVVNTNENNDMSKVAKDLKTRAISRVNLQRVDTPLEVLGSLSKIMNDRGSMQPPIAAEPVSRQNSIFGDAYRQMTIALEKANEPDLPPH